MAANVASGVGTFDSFFRKSWFFFSDSWPTVMFIAILCCFCVSGFVGAGVITTSMRNQNKGTSANSQSNVVHGLTTAATIW